MADDDTKRRAHAMPFGAEILLTGGVCFRLWAPDAGVVELCLEDQAGGRQFLPMAAQADGWHQLVVAGAGPGALYRFRIDHGLLVPDPASRCQQADVHGPSLVVDPREFAWLDHQWPGRPWEEAVIYEVHTGAFSPTGDFAGVTAKLDYLVELGVTALELMPVADFPGRRDWGYDGALIFAPDRVYGRPADLKGLVQAAHARGLMVFLDVVYNHFGPEGNYLHVYGRPFFTPRYQTPWGAALNFSGEKSRTVRDFFIHNALYWLEEYHMDGLRFDAVHAIWDESRPDILEELAARVQAGPGRERHIHLVLENDKNNPDYLARKADGPPRYYAAQWNDDIHHAWHVILTGEQDGYYRDYSEAPLRHLGRCLTEGFAYQGEISPYRHGAVRGGNSRHLPPTAFVAFMQNHDQIGNRAFGERLTVLAEESLLRLTAALLVLSPAPPLFFMGEEFGAKTPFLFFCDFGPDLAGQVAAGRRQEFARFPQFQEPQRRAAIPDPNDIETFRRSCLDWRELDAPAGRRFLAMYKKLLSLRRQEIIPRLTGMTGGAAHYHLIGPAALAAGWRLGDNSQLSVMVNFGEEPVAGVTWPAGPLLYAEPEIDQDCRADPILPRRCIAWFLAR